MEHFFLKVVQKEENKVIAVKVVAHITTVISPWGLLV